MTDFRNDEGRDQSIRVEESEDVYVVRHDFDEQDLTVTISLALSEIGNITPTEIIPEFPKYVDPDALDRLFRPRPRGERRQGGPLHLAIKGYDITIYSTGRIEIEPRRG